jgi:hypothetical protein
MKFVVYLMLGCSLISIEANAGKSREEKENALRLRLQKKTNKNEESTRQLNKLSQINERAQFADNVLKKNQNLIVNSNSNSDPLAILKKRKIKPAEREQITEVLSAEGIKLEEVPVIKAKFIAALDSGIKFVKNASSRLNEERDYHLGRNPSFTKDKAFGFDFIPFKDKRRKSFVLCAQPLVKAGIPTLETLREKFIAEDPNDFKCVMRMYIGLLSFAQIQLAGSNDAIGIVKIMTQQQGITRKAERLLFSVYDGEINQALNTAELLFPYFNAIQSVLKIPNFEVFSNRVYEQQINETLVQRSEKLNPRLLPSNIAAVIRESVLSQQKEIVNKGGKQTTKPDRSVQQEGVESSVDFYESSTAHNLKKNYREPSEQELRDERKRQAKRAKKAASLQDMEPQEKNIVFIEETIEKKEEQEEALLIKIGGGPFRTFKKIIDKTYRGSMEKVMLLFQALGGKVDEGRSGSRIKFELAHIANGKYMSLDTLPLENDEEEETINLNIEGKECKQEAVLHNPHKGGSNKLRPYHVTDIRDLLIEAGYNNQSVGKQ